VRENAKGVHDGKVGRGQETECQVTDQREMGKLCLKPKVGQGALPVEQDFW
jgi:hypothetical protein